jgi:hypothetical protein
VNHVISSATEYLAKEKAIHSNDEIKKYLFLDEFLSDLCIAAYFFHYPGLCFVLEAKPAR